MDLKNAARAVPEKDDKFSDVMGQFCADAKAECDVLNGMFKNLESLYTELDAICKLCSCSFFMNLDAVCTQMLILWCILLSIGQYRPM